MRIIRSIEHLIKSLPDYRKGRTYLTVMFLLLVALSMSCEEKINLELNTDKNARLVVEGRLTNQSEVQFVQLTRTSSYFSNDSVQPEQGAVVSISGRVNTVRLYEDLGNPGYYRTSYPVSAVIGHTYTLNITTKNDEHYEAKAYLDTVAAIDSIAYEYQFNKYLDHGFYKLRLFAHEPKGKGNIYMFNIYVNDTLDNRNLGSTRVMTDEFVDGQYLPGIEIYYINENRIVKGDNLVKVDMLSISRDEYDFINAFLDETVYSGGLFSGPPANVPSNIKCTDKNGTDGLGFFGASAVSSYYLIISKK